MTQLDVTIMGQPYKLACKEGEETDLLNAVSYLDTKMNLIRDSGKVRGTDRIAVMAALSIAAEMLAMKSGNGPFSDMTVAEVKQRISAMHAVLDSALNASENMR